jgi:hypothetical protein
MKKYFCYDPECGMEEFETRTEALRHAKLCVAAYFDYDFGWDEEVEKVIVGEIQLRATKCNVIDKPPESDLDEYECDEDGTDWSNFQYRCDYRMNKI